MYSIERLMHHFYLPYFKRRPTGLEALSFNYTISQIAAGMLGSFGVLFIFGLGHSLTEGLWLVMVFFGLQRVVTGILVPLVAKLISKTGYRWMMFSGLMSLALKTFLLMQVNRLDWGLLAIALLSGGWSIASYYLSYHGLFLDDNDETQIGKQIGLVTMGGRVAVMIGPVLAGLIVEDYGFSYMFGIVMILLIVSLAPLFLMPRHQHESKKYKVREAVGLLIKPSGFLDSTIWWHIENGLQSFFWPVLLFLIMKDYLKFGMVVSGVMMLNCLAVYFSGKIYDQRKLKRGYPMVTVLAAFGNILRYSARMPLMAVSADSLNRVFSPFWWMKIRRNALLDGESYPSMVFASAWEWAVTIGYLISLVVGYWILRQTGGNWAWLVIPAVASNVMAAIGVRKDE